LQVRVARDIRERLHARQAVGGANGVVIGQAVIPAALNVQRG